VDFNRIFLPGTTCSSRQKETAGLLDGILSVGQAGDRFTGQSEERAAYGSGCSFIEDKSNVRFCGRSTCFGFKFRVGFRGKAPALKGMFA
ncbi:MAG TPA: hypothetical protein H9671_03500, partial [Firmicutes bacterium]|nr:hypothetical protein [Bacillota bacterium]